MKPLAAPERRRTLHRQGEGTAAWELNMYSVLSFDVYGTLVNTPPVNAKVFRSILAATNASHVDAQAFYQFWEQRNIASYFKPYASYKEICRHSLREAFEHFGIHDGDADLISHYFCAFKEMKLGSSVESVGDF